MENALVKKLMRNYSIHRGNKYFKLGMFLSLSHCSAQIVGEYAEKLSWEVEAVSSRMEQNVLACAKTQTSGFLRKTLCSLVLHQVIESLKLFFTFQEDGM